MRARAMTFRRIAVLTLLAGLLIGAVPAGGAQAGDFNGRYKDRWQMLRATNGSRNHHRVHRVDLRKRMSDLARKHSVAMARRGSLFHVNDPSSFYLRGVRWHWWGENVGVTGGSVADVQRAFMHSSGHRGNILNRAFDNVAIGAVRVDGALWVTVFFWG